MLVLDDLSTGRTSNVEHVLKSARVEFVQGSVLDRSMVHDLPDAADASVHLASAVGLGLVVDCPVDTLLNDVLAAALENPVLLTSTSEIYGRSDGRIVSEDSNRIVGPTSKSAVELLDLQGVRRGARAGLSPLARGGQSCRAALQHGQRPPRPGSTAWSFRGLFPRRSPVRP